MKASIVALCLGMAMFEAHASDRWAFEAKIAVTGAPASGVYHHLDGAGRKHLAVSTHSVAAVWEDNRSQDPQIYVATKPRQQRQFSSALQVSTGAEAYEPAIATLPGDRFVLTWEQDAAIYARVLGANGLAPPLELGKEPS